MLFNSSFKKNSEYMLNTCSKLIKLYQSHNSSPSCENDLLELVKNKLYSCKKEVSSWNDSKTDYNKLAHTLLANYSFDLLSSGKYHIYAGALNPMSCANNLLDVYNGCMEYGLKMGMFDEGTRKEQYKYLMDCISSVG